ncbi:helix-turn-helix domain-containing protein [Seonamhaeicola maritimus]|uniref:Helix-turn-helix domain-containing protein n=1 Tax=Seonamhaeicola maritimus TaxID=2591822 RepID=A0A5C7GGL4_9FLAO|nr:helix-turn-helix domain-containing protein [Seonamhaeicola maritimus]TXG36744.1 helix-turn-helix domain-containing protein [Seonamhaeicola maritimus]
MKDELSDDQGFTQKIEHILEVNLEDENFGVSNLALEIGLSRSQLYRKLQDATGKSTSQFIREYRLKRAMEMLKKNQFTAAEIAYRVGFSSPTYFNTCFHNFFGYPPGEVKYQNTAAPPKKTVSKKLLSIAPIIILIVLIVFNEKFKNKDDGISSIEKTIAIMPFENDSPNNENQYFCNGIMTGIREYLTKIPDFKIASRRSTEKFRNKQISLKAIANELDVNYLIEGRVQRIGNKAIVSAELINVKEDKVVWSESYNEDVSEIFKVQADVVQSITENLETAISSNLKSELSTDPTKDKYAYEYRLQGDEYLFKANSSLQKHKVWLDLLDKAKSSYEKAIKRDSLFASAYIGLALTTFQRYGNYVGEDNKFDEVLYLTNKAIALNPNYAFAYKLRGDYFVRINKEENAILDYEKSLTIYPNDVGALFNLIGIHKRKNKYKEAIFTLQKIEKFAQSRGQLMGLYTNYLEFYRTLENHQMVDYYFDKIFELQTVPRFRRDRVYSFIQSMRYDEALAYVNKTLVKDNQQRNALLGMLYLYKRDVEKATPYYKKCYKQVEKEGVNSLASRSVYWGYGMCLLRGGQIEKGKNLLRRQAELYNNLLSSKQSLDRPVSYYVLFFIYGALGDIEKSNECIDKFEEVDGWLFWNLISYIKADLEAGFFEGDIEYLNASMKRGEKQLEEVQNIIRPYLPSAPPE